MNAVYIRLLESSGGRIVETAAEMGLKGFNVTAPAKTDILSHLAELSNEAELVRAVNTVTVDGEGRMTGHNTDWMGVVLCLQAAGADPAHKKALVLGAGGAGRAAVYGLRRSGAARVILINRTESKGKQAAKRLGVEFRPLDDLGRTVAECRGMRTQHLHVVTRTSGFGRTGGAAGPIGHAARAAHGRTDIVCPQGSWGGSWGFGTTKLHTAEEAQAIR